MQRRYRSAAPKGSASTSLTAPEYRTLQDLSERISAGLEERQRARDEVSARANELFEEHQRLQQEYTEAFREVYGGV